MNRFFDITEFCLAELMPAEIARRQIKDKSAQFILRTAPLRFQSDIAGGVIVVPMGYQTNLASIPSWAWSVFMEPDDPRISAGSVLHDYLYEHNGIVILEDGTVTKLSREQCDKILIEAMIDLGATVEQQEIVYIALRRFGDKWSDGQ